MSTTFAPGTLELLELEDAAEESDPVCRARAECQNIADWFALCPRCAARSPWCSSCKHAWETQREFEMGLAASLGQSLTVSHDDCGAEFQHDEFRFLPIR